MVDQKLRAIAHTARRKTLTIYALAIAVLAEAGPNHHYRAIGQHGHIGIRLNARSEGVGPGDAGNEIAVGIEKAYEDIRGPARAGFPSDHAATVGQQGHPRVDLIDIRQILAGHQRGPRTGQVGIQPLHQNPFAFAVGRSVLPHDKSSIAVGRGMRILLMTRDIAEQWILATQRRQCGL